MLNRQLLVLAAAAAVAVGAIVALTQSDDDAPGAARTTAQTLPFHAEGPFGREPCCPPMVVEPGSEVISIDDSGAPTYIVRLRITGDVESVLDAYAKQLGCGPDADPSLTENACIRRPGYFELVGLAGGDFFSITTFQSDGEWFADLGRADG